MEEMFKNQWGRRWKGNRKTQGILVKPRRFLYFFLNKPAESISNESLEFIKVKLQRWFKFNNRQVYLTKSSFVWMMGGGKIMKKFDWKRFLDSFISMMLIQAFNVQIFNPFVNEAGMRILLSLLFYNKSFIQIWQFFIESKLNYFGNYFCSFKNKSRLVIYSLRFADCGRKISWWNLFDFPHQPSYLVDRLFLSKLFSFPGFSGTFHQRELQQIFA